MDPCERTAACLMDYVEGELEAGDRREVLRHVAYCPPCRHFVESYHKTTVLCRMALRRPPPEGSVTRLVAFLRHATSTWPGQSR